MSAELIAELEDWVLDKRQGVYEVRHEGWVVGQVTYTTKGWRLFRRPSEQIPEAILEHLPEGAAALMRKVVPR